MVMMIEERILNKSKELFFRYGLRNVTMDDIARELGISKKTLYSNFDKKKTIVREVTKNFLTCQEGISLDLARESKDAIHELIGIMDQVNSVFESLDLRIIQDMKRHFPESWLLFEQHKQEIILKLIVENLKRGIEAGLFRPEINVKIIAKMRLELIQLAMDPEVFPMDEFEIKEIHYQLLLQYVHGISTLKGYKLINQYLNRNEE